MSTLVRLQTERAGSVEAFLAAIVPGCEAFDVGADRLALVRELVLLFRRRPDGSLLSDEQQSDLALLLILVFLAGDEGSTRVPLAGTAWLARRLGVVLGAESGDDPAIGQVVARLRALAGDARLAHVISTDEGAYLPLIRRGEHLYAQRMLLLERSLTEQLAALLARPAPPWAADATAVRAVFDAVASSGPFTLKPRQAYAMLTAVHSPVTVISGGPGTGKTTIVVSILRMLARLGVPLASIALAAPTGKAAYRMGEAIEKNLRNLPAPAPEDAAILAAALEPQTLHRLLGVLPGGKFRHHEGNRLAARVVIVDEASMIDLFLMERLVRAVGPQASLILLGDADQLPSVEAGAVFRDLVPVGFHPAGSWAGWVDGLPAAEGTPGRLSPFAVRLHENVRVVEGAAGASLQAIAAAVNERRADGLVEWFTQAANADAIRYEGAEWLAVEQPKSHKRKLHGFLRAWHAKWYANPAFRELAGHVYDFRSGRFSPEDEARLTKLFALLEHARLLCPTRVGLAGAETVNAHLHGLSGALGGPAKVPGEPVLMLQNDYERKIFNGDQGVIVQIDAGEGPEAAAVFQRGKTFTALALATLGAKIEHAFAITVHKSQGSEYESVAVLLPVQPTPFLTKEILYTAFTRCKRSLVVVGGTAVLAAGVAVQIERDTGVAERLSR